jgi:[ribosomal protein S18]-alanine N-acetyltransferase
VSALLEPRRLRRPMSVADIGAVMAIEGAAYRFPWTGGNFIDSLAAGYLAEVIEAPDGELIGYFVAMPSVGELHLLNLTIAPERQGRGHGSALLEAVRAHATELGLGAMWLEVRDSNERARALYRRGGFAEVGRRRGYYPAEGGRREDAIVMRTLLAGPGRDAVD